MSVVQKYIVQYEKLCQYRTRVFVFVMVLTAVAVVGFQNFTLNPGHGLIRPFPLLGRGTSPDHSSSGAEDVAEVHLSSDSENSAFPSHEVENREVPLAGKRVKHHPGMNEIDEESDDFDIDGDGEQNDELSIDLGDGMTLKKVKDPYGGYVTIQKSAKEAKDSLAGMDGEAGRGFVSTPSKDGKTNSSLEFYKVKRLDNNSIAPSPLPYPASSYVDKDTHVKQNRNSSDFVVNVVLNNSSSGKNKIETIARSDETASLESGKTTTNCKVARDHAMRKKMKQAAMTISDMNHLLSKTRASSCSMIPQWSSENDLQILDAKKQIMNAPIVKSDPELYPALFRNISMFKRSYDLMEKTLKVYVYRDGEKPIFHQPELTGIYSSEGWFMKHMEGSQHFVVENPRQAHLFYIPFSSHLLQLQLKVSFLEQDLWCRSLCGCLPRLGNTRNRASYGDLHQSPLQRRRHGGLRAGQRRVPSGDVRAQLGEPPPRPWRKTRQEEAHTRVLRRADARLPAPHPAAALGKQRPRHEGIRPHSARGEGEEGGLRRVHEKQQVLHLPKGVQGEQPEGGGGHLLRVRPRDHSRQLRAPFLRDLELGGLLRGGAGEGCEQAEGDTRVDTEEEVPQAAHGREEGAAAFPLAQPACEV